MDEDDEAHQRRMQEKARRRAPQHKYRDMLQQLANRKIDEVCIELDDLAAVCSAVSHPLRGQFVLTMSVCAV